MDARLPERIQRRISPEPNSGCWLWLGDFDKNGYSKIWNPKGTTRVVHRIVYETLVAKIPAGLVLHHKCRLTACVNPAHLLPVTNQENVLLDDTPAGRNAGRTHCIHGHEFTIKNTYYARGGKRQCRACDLINTYRRRKQKKEPNK